MLHHGGAEKITHAIICNIDFNKFDVSLVLLENKGELLNDLPEELRIIDLEVSRIRYYPLKFIPLLIKEKPDIVLFGWGELAAYVSPVLPFFRKTKFIVRETNIVSQHVVRKEIKFFYRFYSNFDLIIAQSDDMKKDLIKHLGIDPKKIIKINNPIDFKKIEKSSRETFPKEFKVGYQNVLAVGTLTHRKGFDNLIRVFSFLRDRNIFLTVLGIGEDEAKLKKLAKELYVKNIQFLGIKRNPYPYFKHADLFVLSSRYEGFPNVLLEAGASGTFSIANDCSGGIDEIIQPNINGMVCDISNHEEFAKKIEKGLHLRKGKEVIKESIRSRFGSKQILDRFNKILEA